MAPSRSPSSSRPSNHNQNALEGSGALRKGGASNLSKSWSGSEIPKRSPFSKSASPIPVPSPPASFEQKENERDPNCPKQARTRHSATNPSKGMKSFMAPTISAASKIAASSPRKKILAERNQVVRESTESSIVSAEGVRQEEEIRRKSEIGIASEEISVQNMPRKLDFSSSKDHHQPVATHSHDIGILDADDPSFPPYDPKKNYLSPRPRFLHYKPNPKIEQRDLLHAEDARRLEDSFSDSDDSGNAEDCSGTVEDGALMMAQEAQVSHETYVSKPKPRSIRRSKLISFVLILTVVSFCIPFIDSPVLAPLKMKDQSFVGPQTPPFKVLQHFHGYLDVASRNPQGLAARMRQWSLNYIEIFKSFGSFPKELGMSGSLNMTISPSSMAQSADLDLCYKSDFEPAEKKSMINEEDDVDHMEIEFQLDKTDLEALADDGDVAEKINVEFSDEEDKRLRLYTEPVVKFETMIRNEQPEKIEIAKFVEADDGDVAEKIKVEFSDEDDKRLILYTEPVFKFETMINNQQPEKIETVKFVEALEGGDRDVSEEVKVEFSDEDDDFSKYEKRLSLYTEPVVKLEAMITNQQPENIEIAKSEEVYGGVCPVGFNLARKFEDQQGIESSSAYPLVGLQATTKKDLIFSVKDLMAFLGMLATASMAFLFIKQKRTSPSSTCNKTRYKKTKLAPEATNSCRHAANRDLCSSHGGLAEMVSDSGPTEMSSSFKNGLHRSEMRLYPVTPSPEIMQRRESGVSSSFSYGSFTSFERRSRSARKGSKEEEEVKMMMTPVRRSSRIRNQISTSNCTT